MEILSVALKNFKSHSDRQFIFQPGTNAICGENGAGKTSILEAIAWTLFNYRGSYKNEDLIRNGSGSAQAMVEFISNYDGRTYIVKRCTTAGYTIFDPQLGENLEYKRIDEEVMPWLRQQFAVAPGTDLGKLFANTIGVPQGTFTADFLQSPENRKKVFDTVLKVEEYKQTHQQMSSLEKYAKAEVEMLERAIAQYNETLQEWDALQDQRQALAEEITQDETTLQQLQGELATLQTEKDHLAAIAQQVQQLETQMQTLLTQMEGKRQSNQLLEQSVMQARDAQSICQANEAGHRAYIQAEKTLKDLDQQRKTRQQVIKQRDAKQQAVITQQTELTRLTLQLEALSKAEDELQQLRPLVHQQVDLEQQQATLIEHLQHLQGYRVELQNLRTHHQTLQTTLANLTQEAQRLQTLEPIVHQLPGLEQKRDRLQEHLSRIEAAQQFEAELYQLIQAATEKRDRHQVEAEMALVLLQEMQQAVPLLAVASLDAVVTAIQSGVVMNQEMLEALHQILADLREQTSVETLQHQLHSVKQQIDQGYRQQAEFMTLGATLTQQQQIQDDLGQIQGRAQELQQVLLQEPELQERRSHLLAALADLKDPRGRSQLLTRDLQQRDRLQAEVATIQQSYATLNQEMAALEAELAMFAELDSQIEQQQQIRQTHQSAYLAYLQSQNAAATLTTLEADLQGAIAQLQTLDTQHAALKAAYQQVRATYEPEQWHRVEAAYIDIRSRCDRIQGSLPQQQKLLSELDKRLSILQEVSDKRDRTQVELKQKEKVRKFITFARKVYKEAGPRITERYVLNISREADRLFRELMNRSNTALEWTRDYEIIVQEGAHTRRFVNLSGGEQMCAALAVRLALLRVLADIDVAFFDEPTTNMDRPRRESLAEAIANIRSFRQLFVISHDDTFEKVTENVILVEREAG